MVVSERWDGGFLGVDNGGDGGGFDGVKKQKRLAMDEVAITYLSGCNGLFIILFKEICSRGPQMFQ